MTRRTAEEQRAAYQAALATQHGPAPTDIAPAPARAPDALDQVLIHLSPFVAGLADRPLGDDARWRWLTGVTPAQVIRRVLMRLDRRADQVALRASAGSDGVEILDRAIPDIAPDGVGSGGPEGPTIAVQEETLLAIVFDTPAAALRLAWAALMPAAEVERHAIEGATILTLKLKEAA